MAKESSNSQLCAILSYLLIGIIWYLVDDKMHKDAHVKFHVKQGIILLIAAIIYNIALGILFTILFWGFFGMLAWIFQLLYYLPLVLMVIGIINAVNRKQKELPVIGHYAKKLTF